MLLKYSCPSSKGEIIMSLSYVQSNGISQVTGEKWKYFSSSLWTVVELNYNGVSQWNIKVKHGHTDLLGGSACINPPYQGNVWSIFVFILYVVQGLLCGGVTLILKSFRKTLKLWKHSMSWRDEVLKPRL